MVIVCTKMPILSERRGFLEYVSAMILGLNTAKLLQRCQIFWGQHAKTRGNIPNDQKIYRMDTKFTKWP
jgi:hypothetical protein